MICRIWCRYTVLAYPVHYFCTWTYAGSAVCLKDVFTAGFVWRSRIVIVLAYTTSGASCWWWWCCWWCCWWCFLLVVVLANITSGAFWGCCGAAIGAQRRLSVLFPEKDAFTFCWCEYTLWYHPYLMCAALNARYILIISYHQSHLKSLFYVDSGSI